MNVCNCDIKIIKLINRKIDKNLKIILLVKILQIIYRILSYNFSNLLL